MAPLESNTVFTIGNPVCKTRFASIFPPSGTRAGARHQFAADPEPWAVDAESCTARACALLLAAENCGKRTNIR